MGPLTSSEELSLNWRTAVTFGTILPTAKTSGKAQRNRTWAAIPNPPQSIGDRVVRPWSAGERRTHSSIGDRCTNENSKRHTSVAYLPFRWHQRDPALVHWGGKELRVAAAPLRRRAVSWTELRCLPAREANWRSSDRGGEFQWKEDLMSFFPKLRINGIHVSKAIHEKIYSLFLFLTELLLSLRRRG